MAEVNTSATTTEAKKSSFKDEAVQIVKFSTQPVRAKTAAIIALIALGIGAVATYLVLHRRHEKAMDVLYKDYNARLQEIGQLKDKIDNPDNAMVDRALATLK